MRNPHLPSINGYVKSKDGPKSEAITPHNAITSESAITKGTQIGMLINFIKYIPCCRASVQ